MKGKKSKILETESDDGDWVRIDPKVTFLDKTFFKKEKYHRGLRVLSLKWLLVVFLLYFLRFSEAHKAAQGLNETLTVLPVDGLLGQGLDPRIVSGLHRKPAFDKPEEDSDIEKLDEPIPIKEESEDESGFVPIHFHQRALQDRGHKPKRLKESVSDTSSTSSDTDSDTSDTDSESSFEVIKPLPLGAGNLVQDPFSDVESSSGSSTSNGSSSNGTSSNRSDPFMAESLSPEAKKVLDANGNDRTKQEKALLPEPLVPKQYVNVTETQTDEPGNKREPVEGQEEPLVPTRPAPRPPQGSGRTPIPVPIPVPPENAPAQVPVTENAESEVQGPQPRYANSRASWDESMPGELSGSSFNIFQSAKKPTLPQAPAEPEKKGSSTGDDDFELLEVEKVEASKLDPHMTQHADNSLLKNQRESQLIGTQIPLATSFEYNRRAHVLEPKFEQPKTLGGIIQTLTDKEAKLRRREKRKLKIQHDLNLYISKESANVVNMLNNGEVNRLQKVHPLVFMRLQEVFQTQYALDALVKKDGEKVKRYDKHWYLNSTPTLKKSFIEEIRKYSKDPELYGKFKKPSKMKESRENVYNKLELFHNEYICQRVVRENQYADKILRSMEQQSGLYLAPYYHNIVPGLGNLWLMKNFEKYYMDAVKSKATTFGKVAPTLVGRFMLMVENGTILPSTPSSQVAIHALEVMLTLIMDGVRDPSIFLGKKKFYGFMSLCDPTCLELIFEDANKSQSHMAKRQIEFLKWVLTFYSEDLMLVDTAAQKIVLNNMYAVTREDIFRSSARNIQLRIQSQFSEPTKAMPKQSYLELDESSDLGDEDEDLEDEDDESLLEMESSAGANREKKLRKANEQLLKELGDKRRQEYRRIQLEKVLEQQKKELERQRDEKENDTFQKAMRERERMIREAKMQAHRNRVRQEVEVEKPLFKKEVPELVEKEEKKKENVINERNLYETAKNKLENLGSSYKVFLNRFMTGYHVPGKDVDPDGTSQSIVPFHVFVPSNRASGGYDGQFLDVVQTITDLVNLANKEHNVYFHALNTFILVRTVHSALHSFESVKTKRASNSRTIGSLFRWLNTDSSRYVSHVPKKYLPFASLSLQLVMFFQEVVENYTNRMTKSLKMFFKSAIRWEAGRSFKRARTFAKLNDNFETQVIYDSSGYKASLDGLKEVVDLFKDTFISKPSVPAPVIQFVTIFTALWAQSDSETFNLSERGVHKAKKMFLLSFLSNEQSLAEMATEMVLKNCNGLKMLHLGCVARISSQERDCNQISVALTKKKVLHIMRALEATSLDPLDVVRIASDTCRRCASNLTVRTHVGAPIPTFLEMSEQSGMKNQEKQGGSGDNPIDYQDSDSVSSVGSTESSTVDSDSESVDGDSTDKMSVDGESSADEDAESVFKGVSKKDLTSEEEEMMLPHFTDRLMLHSEITHKVQCYLIQKRLVDALVDALGGAKDEPDARHIVANVFADFRTIEVVQSGMASSIHRLICPYMMDAEESLRVPTQQNILKHAIKKVASKPSLDILHKDLMNSLMSKVPSLVPSPESFQILPDLAGCVFVGSRKYNGVFFSGGYAPFAKVEKPNIALKPGEGRLVYDGDNFVSELSALSDVTDLESINVVHERDYDKYVYKVRGNGASDMVTERQFALKYHNFVVRAHVLVTARALLRMGFDMGRVIWCGDRYGWVADFAMDDVASFTDVPVYNGNYWLLTSELSVQDVVGEFPVSFMNDKVNPATGKRYNLDNVRLGDLNVEIKTGGRKVADIKPNSSDVVTDVETSDDEEQTITNVMVSSVGDSVSATPGAVKTVRSATFNPAANSLTLDLDMPEFVFGA